MITLPAKLRQALGLKPDKRIREFDEAEAGGGTHSPRSLAEVLLR